MAEVVSISLIYFILDKKFKFPSLKFDYSLFFKVKPSFQFWKELKKVIPILNFKSTFIRKFVKVLNFNTYFLISCNILEYKFKWDTLLKLRVSLSIIFHVHLAYTIQELLSDLKISNEEDNYYTDCWNPLLYLSYWFKTVKCWTSFLLQMFFRLLWIVKLRFVIWK